jgi:hypothetical protein
MIEHPHYCGAGNAGIEDEGRDRRFAPGNVFAGEALGPYV